MRLLLDTHAVIWWFAGNTRMTSAVRREIDHDETEVFVSAASAFEIALKVRLGKLPDARALATNLGDMVDEQGFQPLSITVGHALAAGALPLAHGDPFDRLLVAQALFEDLVLVSNERVFDQTGVRRLW